MPAESPSSTKSNPFGLEETVRLASEGPAELTKCLQGGVLAGAFEAIQRWPADAEAPGHSHLGKSSLASKEPQGFRQGFRKIHPKTLVDSTVHM